MRYGIGGVFEPTTKEQINITLTYVKQSNFKIKLGQFENHLTDYRGVQIQQSVISIKKDLNRVFFFFTLLNGTAITWNKMSD